MKNTGPTSRGVDIVEYPPTIGGLKAIEAGLRSGYILVLDRQHGWDLVKVNQYSRPLLEQACGSNAWMYRHNHHCET
jgi:hypothetical protein